MINQHRIVLDVPCRNDVALAQTAPAIARNG